jgi:hypothetical protein
MFSVMNAGCGGVIEHDMLAPTSCHAEPVVAGLWFAAHGRTAWLGFACDRHAPELIAPRPLLPRDRNVLERRRDRHRTELAGRRWAGEQEGPLARGAAAEKLVERAKAWTERHADR